VGVHGNHFFSTSLGSGFVSDLLKIEHVGDLELLGRRALDRTHAKVGREVAAAAVDLGQEGYGDEVQRGRIDQKWQGLPLGKGEADLVGDGCGLGRQGLLGIYLGVDLDQSLDRLAGNGLDLLAVVGGEGVGEVEEDYNLNSSKTSVFFGEFSKGLLYTKALTNSSSIR